MSKVICFKFGASRRHAFPEMNFLDRIKLNSINWMILLWNAVIPLHFFFLELKGSGWSPIGNFYSYSKILFPKERSWDPL